MIKLIGLIVLLQCQIFVYGQAQNATGENTIDVTTVPGTYHYKSASFKINKNQTCKIVFSAPQKLIYEGVWQVQHDTLVCTYYHINLNMDGINEELKEEPFSQKFILSDNTLSLMDGENNALVVYHKEEE